MTSAEDALCGLRQGGLRLERYVEEFLEISNRMSWHEAALGGCFLLGLDDGVIHCDLPVSDFPLIELINLILFLNVSDDEVEEIPLPRHPTPAGTRHVSPAHPTPRTSAYLSNSSYRLPNHKDPPASKAASSSLALSRRPQLRQAHVLLLSQALYPHLQSAPQVTVLPERPQVTALPERPPSDRSVRLSRAPAGSVRLSSAPAGSVRLSWAPAGSVRLPRTLSDHASRAPPWDEELPQENLGEGYPPWRPPKLPDPSWPPKLPAPPWPPELHDPPWPPESPDPLRPPELPAPPWPPELPASPWPPELPAPPWPPELPAPPWPPELPAPPWPPELPALPWPPELPLRHGRTSSPIRHGLPSPRIHHGRPSSPPWPPELPAPPMAARVPWPAMAPRTGAALEASRATTPPCNVRLCISVSCVSPLLVPLYV